MDKGIRELISSYETKWIFVVIKKWNEMMVTILQEIGHVKRYAGVKYSTVVGMMADTVSVVCDNGVDV